MAKRSVRHNCTLRYRLKPLPSRANLQRAVSEKWQILSDRGRSSRSTYRVSHRRSSAFVVHPLDSPWKDYEMRKAFTRKPQADEPATPGKNYITRSGLQRLKDEHRFRLHQGTPRRDGGGGMGRQQR
jgi:hypothetical protein